MSVKNMRYSIPVLVLVLFFLMCGSSFADEFHYNNFLIGDRASGMGGAYTAVSDDPTGLYYNPAGIVYATGKNLSASVNAYYSLNKKYDNIIGGNGWERKSSSLLPNFFGITQPLGSFQFGFSYVVPDSIQENQSQTFGGSLPTTLGSPATNYTINFNNEDTYNPFWTFTGQGDKQQAFPGSNPLSSPSEKSVHSEPVHNACGRAFRMVESVYRSGRTGVPARHRRRLVASRKTYRGSYCCKDHALR